MFVKAWTDGSCSPNPGTGGWAYIAQWYLNNEKQERVCSGKVKNSTNNQMELEAVFQLVTDVASECILEITTDSSLVVGWLDQGWKRNIPEIKIACNKIDKLIKDKRLQVNFILVKGHSANHMNNRVDELAVAARNKR